VSEHRNDAARTADDGTGPVSLDWQPEPADWMQVFAARRKLRREAFKLSVMAAVGAGVAGLGFVLHRSFLVGIGLTAVVAVAAARLVRPFIVGSFWRKSPGLRRRVSAVVDADGIALHTEEGSRRHRWTALGPVLETDRVFVVHLAGGRAFFPLAKRGAADPADVARLRGMLQRASAGH
jgi:hypothetical protein